MQQGSCTLLSFPSVPGEMTRAELSSQNNMTRTYGWIQQLRITTWPYSTDKQVMFLNATNITAQSETF